MSLRYDGKVVIVTGAGGGMNIYFNIRPVLCIKRYLNTALIIGASVVVNDLGGSHTGEGTGNARVLLIN